jgi:hypothetical protein
VVNVQSSLDAIQPTLDAILAIGIAVLILGTSGALALLIRASVIRKAYLRRFRPEIDFYADDPRYFPGSMRPHYAELRQVLYQRQPDPDQEHARRKVWRPQRQAALCFFATMSINVGLMVFMRWLYLSAR